MRGSCLECWTLQISLIRGPQAKAKTLLTAATARYQVLRSESTGQVLQMSAASCELLPGKCLRPAASPLDQCHGCHDESRANKEKPVGLEVTQLTLGLVSTPNIGGVSRFFT